jgi:hypothetical protein
MQLLNLCREVSRLRGAGGGSCVQQMPGVPGRAEPLQAHHEATMTAIAVICERVLRAESARAATGKTPRCGAPHQDLPSENNVFH